MFSPNEYELIDFGAGRKLERFGDVVLDRPAPAAAKSTARKPAAWKRACARYLHANNRQGRWNVVRSCPETWTVRHATMVLELKLAASGAVGVFPEQAINWDWLDQRISRAKRPMQVLNLFAYTGGSTLAAAAAGARVTHVDAARSVVNWARRCASGSHLDTVPIRWIVDDAVQFTKRERRRGRTYDGIILDPPTYGHGPRREAWHIDRDLPGLLQVCRQLLSDQPVFFMLSCHAPTIGPATLEAMVADHVLGGCQSGVRARRLFLRTQDRRRLDSGIVARWPN